MQLKVDFAKIVVGQEMVEEANNAISSLADVDTLINQVIDLSA